MNYRVVRKVFFTSAFLCSIPTVDEPKKKKHKKKKKKPKPTKDATSTAQDTAAKESTTETMELEHSDDLDSDN